MLRFGLFLCLVLAVSCYRNDTKKVCDGGCLLENFNSIGMQKVMPLKEAEWEYSIKAGIFPQNKAYATNTKCVEGRTLVHEGYGCNNVDLLSYISNKDLGTDQETSDIWGATVVHNGRTHFIAIVGHSDGTSFVDITDAENPIILGNLPTFDCSASTICTRNQIWRDIKVFNDRAYIVSENYNHGLQIVDLQRVLTEHKESGRKHIIGKDKVYELSADSHFDGFGKAHNIALNPDTGYAYVIGSNKCNGGLYILNVNEREPVYDGCYFEDGYTHDCQCMTYSASCPDSRYHNHEICFNYNEDTLTIVDVTDKDNIELISRTYYEGSQYTHQGWLSQDCRFLYLDDELDEMKGTTRDYDYDPLHPVDHGSATRTLIWEVEDLQNPRWFRSFFSAKNVIDHNMYIRGDIAYQSNYCGGIRVLDITDVNNIEEIAFFDCCPDCDGPFFQGAWSNYPYFEGHSENTANSNLVVLSSIERGLYVLRVNLPAGKGPGGP